MEQKQISCGSIHDRLPPLSAKYPWLVSQRLEAEEDSNGAQILYTIHDPLSHYRCRIPELLGRRIRGCFHGWVILSSYPDQVMWSLWNPLTCKTIVLPPLRILKDEGDSVSCCLSSPPHDPYSILLLTRINKSTIVFCRLDRKKRKRLRWTEMTYAKQLRSITGFDNDSLHCLTFCNGKLYASSSVSYSRLVQVDIVFKDRQVVISLLPLGNLPFPSYNTCDSMWSFLKGSCTELFYITLGFDSVAKKSIGAVYLFKLDMISMIWEEMEDIKDTVFFVNLAHYCSVDCMRAVASELGGYIHILGKMGKVIYSCDVKDKTVSESRLPCLEPTVHVSLWECMLQGDHDEEIKCRANSKQEDDKEEEIVVRSGLGDDDDDDDDNSTRNEEKNLLVNIPFDVLEKIMKTCIGVDYLQFRATSKYCRLVAPMTGWRNTTHEVRRRFQTYSLVSPWLVVFDKYKGIITFTDPMFGDKYFIKTPRELIGEYQVFCSRYGWLLLLRRYEALELLFFNPFTKDVRELPHVPGVDSLCFSEPPTSPDCMVVGFSAILPWHVYVLFVNRQQPWLRVRMNFGSVPNFFKFPTFYGGDRDIYALNGGELNVFREIVMEERSFYAWDHVVAEAPRGCSTSQSPLYFLIKCDQHLLLVVVDEFGESIEVFKWRNDWEKIDSLGRHMIYICDSMCLCIEAKTPEMENKIYFPLHKSGKIVFYSLETCLYHTFNGRNIDQGFRDFFGAKYHVYPHAWIEPSWS